MFSGKSKPGCPYRKTELLEEFKDKALVSGFVCSVLRLPLPKVHSIACECMLLVTMYYFVIACVVTVPFSLHARVMGEGLASHSPFVSFFVILSGDQLACTRSTLGPRISTHQHPSRNAGSDSHQVWISSKVLAKSGPDNSCTLACTEDPSLDMEGGGNHLTF